MVVLMEEVESVAILYKYLSSAYILGQGSFVKLSSKDVNLGQGLADHLWDSAAFWKARADGVICLPHVIEILGSLP